MPKTSQRFPAVVHKLGINPCVDVPVPVVSKLLQAAGRMRAPVPVRGSVNGTPIKATVVKYAGAWRLYLNGEMRQNAGVQVGDRVDVSVRFDPAPRVLAVPLELRAALKQNANAREKWDALAPSHRREFLAYLNSLKTKESLARNVRNTVRLLLER